MLVTLLLICFRANKDLWSTYIEGSCSSMIGIILNMQALYVLKPNLVWSLEVHGPMVTEM